jgi:CheY-like chemotaxis protein
MVGGQRGWIVLVVEDEALVRGLIADEFAADGWIVVEAAKGEEALDLVNEFQVGVVFTDIQLGGQLSGWDEAEALRATRDDLPVIYTSGNTADKSRQVPASLFFDKPYDPREIVGASAKLLEAA